MIGRCLTATRSRSICPGHIFFEAVIIKSRLDSKVFSSYATDTKKPVMELTAQNSTFLKDLDTIMFDCDGVLWDGRAQPIPGAVEVLEILRKMGKRLFFITNNSTKTRKQYAERCQSIGIQANEDEIICTAWLIASYLKDVLNFSGKTYLIGGAALEAEFKNKGLEYIGPGIEDYGDVEKGYASYLDIKLDPDVNAVAVGFDPYINYVKVVKAASYAQKASSIFVASNTDSFFPTKGDIRLPGTGALVNFVKTAATREPVVVGKPNTLSKDILEKTHGAFTAERTLMVGDRLDTDMLFGKNCGFKTLLVLTGVSSENDVLKLAASNSIEDQKLVPSYYTASLGHLKPFLT